MRPIRHTRLLAASVAAAVSLWLLAACTPTDRFVAGRPITPEELESLGESIRNASPETWNASTLYPAGTVYWMQNSLVHHESPTCGRLAGADKIFVGSLADAEEAGNPNPCSACRGHSETAAETDAS